MTWQTQTASKLVGELQQERLSSAELIRSLADRCEQTENQINAFLNLDPVQALKDPNVDTRRGPLFGIPVAVKDNICTLGQATTAGSKFLEKYRSPFEATVIRRLRDAGAVVMGKTNLDEFGMGSSTENSAFAPTRNPWNLDRVPGGSSGGSAASVAAGSSLWALGSDTGGSIRQPSAFCGTTGLKPTYGRVSRYGLIAFASSLDQIGPIARDARDAALLLSVIAGHDPLDSTSSQLPVGNYLDRLEQPISGLRIGFFRDHLAGLNSGMTEAIKNALEVFHSLGATIVDVSENLTQAAVAAYYIIAGCEASSNLARYDGVRYTARYKTSNSSGESNLSDMYRKSRARYFGAEVQRRILLGTFALSSGYFDEYYLKASRIRRLVKNDFDDKFEKVDLLIGPTTPTTAFPFSKSDRPPLELYRGDVFTVSANLAGIPAISIPCGMDSGLPVGLQILGPRFSESRLLQAAHQYQCSSDWHLRRPQL